MKSISNFTINIIAGIVLTTLVAPGIAHTQQAGIKRTNLQRHDLGIKGKEMVQIRVDIEPGIMFPRHTHPGEEIVYVLEGLLEYTIEGKAPVTLKAGDVFFVPAGTGHAAKNVGSGKGSELATYLIEKGKPLTEICK